MGRGKLRMELIKNEKVRNAAFEKRKKGIVKSANELSTLCGVQIGMIINEPGQNNNEPTIWPANREVITKLIDSYKSKSAGNDCRYGTYNLPAFFKNQTEKIEDEVNKLRKRTREVKYPKWDERLDTCSEDELKDFAGKLTAKIESARVRINSIKVSRSTVFVNPSAEQFQQQQYYDGRFNMGNQRMMIMNNGNYAYNNMQDNRMQDWNVGNYGFGFDESRVPNGGFDPNFGNYGMMRVNGGAGNGESRMSFTVPNVGPIMPYTNAPTFEQLMPFYTPNEGQMASVFPQMQAAQEGDYLQRHGF
ncbi:PREDICTED: floral homeotic protein PMADS 2-like [Erythranthe guttata]|nr:PREDICTED: floral homeotic protein PMADS 2-like [Erythranthe guttata]|eukprot:XP_012827797.1 PREDICTED: floral homeotic protein PMADS 2-like [Erythranthe guttata]